MKPLSISLLLLLGLALTANSQAQDDPIPLRARAALRQNCWRCHNGPSSEGGDVDFLSAKALTEGKLVEPGKPDASRIIERIAANEMPPREITERPSAADGEAIRAWIAAGAKEFPQEATRKFITLEQVMKAMLDHLEKADRQDRNYLRFFTLHQLYNNPRTVEEDLPLYRAALSKALNSLSNKPRIVLPKPVGDAKELFDTVFVIDLRDYDWDRTNAWQRILSQYPYGYLYEEQRSESLKDLEEQIGRLTRARISLVRADWFVTTATRPPLYHEILGIPAHTKTLEQAQNVQIAESFLKPSPERIARAGYAKSGISGQNRMVERHESSHGAYWKSYDFKPDRGRGKLTRFPLGPLNLFPKGKHPFEAQAFVHDGGEIIFSLPNGLQGYMLTDGEDRRIDAGPIEVVSDSLKTSGTSLIVNGVSCMACHKHGMIRLTDTIRDGNSVFGDVEEQVRRLYPEKSKMDELLDRDERRFMEALDKAIGSLLRVGLDKDKPLKEFPEPIGAIARLHRNVYLDAATIACELDIEKPDDIVKKVGEQKLKQLGLDAVFAGKAFISRAEWEAFDGISLAQELGRELSLVPYRPQGP